MGLKKRMKSLTRDVLAELALNYRVQNVFEPRHSAGIWGISFFDRYAPLGHHVFQIAVGPVDEATLSLTRVELLAKLSGRRSTLQHPQRDPTRDSLSGGKLGSDRRGMTAGR